MNFASFSLLVLRHCPFSFIEAMGAQELKLMLHIEIYKSKKTSRRQCHWLPKIVISLLQDGWLKAQIMSFYMDAQCLFKHLIIAFACRPPARPTVPRGRAIWTRASVRGVRCHSPKSRSKAIFSWIFVISVVYNFYDTHLLKVSHSAH